MAESDYKALHMEDTKHCTPCKTKDKETKPEFYCTDCEAYYCEECFELHLRVPYLAKHIVLKHDDIDIWSRDQYKCTSHGKNLEFFCKEHTMLCCHVCISLKHRSCTDMEYILESAMQNNLEDDVKDMMRQIEEQLRIIESCADKVREKTETNQTSRSGYIRELESFRSRINEMFDSLIEKSFEEVKEKFDQNEYYSDNVRQTLTRFEGKLKEFEQLLKSTAVGKEPLVYISLKRAEILVAEFSRELSKLDFSSDKEKYKPVIDGTIEGYVKNIKQIAVIEDERMIQERVASESLSEKDDTRSSEEEVQPSFSSSELLTEVQSFSNSRRVTEVQPSFSSSELLTEVQPSFSSSELLTEVQPSFSSSELLTEVQPSFSSSELLTEVKPSFSSSELLTEVKPSFSSSGLVTEVKPSFSSSGLLTRRQIKNMIKAKMRSSKSDS